MSVSKDKKTGKWYVRVSYKDVDGKYKQKNKSGFDTKKEAQVYEVKLKEELDNGGVPKDITFASYFEDWCKNYKLGRFSESTEKKYLREIKFVKKHFKNKLLKDVTRSDYQSYLNWRGEGNGRDTVEKAHYRLKSAVQNALADGLITKDPSYGAIIKYDNEPDNKIKAWSEAEAGKLFNYFKSDLTPSNVILYICLSTGLRIGEAYALAWDDISDGTLSVKRGYDYNITNDFTDAKTASSHRTIVVNSEFNQIIKKYKMKYQRRYPNYLFLDQFNNPMITHTGLLKHLRKVCRKLGIKELGTHSLRHTHCSLLIYKGVDINYISKRLGHKDVTITLNTYAHIIDEFKQTQDKKIIDVMDELENAK